MASDSDSDGAKKPAADEAAPPKKRRKRGSGKPLGRKYKAISGKRKDPQPVASPVGGAVLTSPAARTTQRSPATSTAKPFNLFGSESDEDSDREVVPHTPNQPAAKKVKPSPVSSLKVGGAVSIYDAAPKQSGELLGTLLRSLYPEDKQIVSTLTQIRKYMKKTPRMETVDDSSDEEDPGAAAAAIVTVSSKKRRALPLGVSPDCFGRNDLTGDKLSKSGERSKRSRAVAKVATGIAAVNTPQQKAAAAFLALTRKNPEVAELLGLDQSAKAKAGSVIVEQLSSFLGRADCLRSNTNDALSVQKTVFRAIVPSKPDAAATPETKAAHAAMMKTMAIELGIKPKTGAGRRFLESDLARRELDTFSAANKKKLLVMHKRPDNTFWNDGLTNSLHNWYFKRCNKVIASPNTKDSVEVRDPNDPQKKIRIQKYFYTWSIRELWLEIIKPERDGGWPHAFKKINKHGKRVFISQSWLMEHLPRNLSRMTNSQRTMCGCSICIDSKGLMASLKGYRQGYWKHMRDEAKRHRAAKILSSEEIEDHFEQASAYRAIHFNGFELQWSTMTDVVKHMTCPFPNEGIFKDAGIPKLQCALGRCAHCTGRMLPVDPSERWLWGQDDIEDWNMILWKQYDGRYQCHNHGLLPEGTSKCPTCAAIPKEKAPKDPRRKVEYCRKRAPIGNYLTDVLQPFMEKYRYHLFLMCALGKNWCLKQREENFRLDEGSVLMVRDYANKLPVEMNDMAQSHGMSNRRAIGSEGITLKYMKDGKKVMDFYSYLATDSKQNAKTSYIHTCQTIEAQIKNGYLKRNSGAKLYEQSDGCSAQYTSATAIKFAILLANRYGIVINRCTTAPQHGKGTCDSQGGWDKAYLRKQFLVSALTDDEYDKGFDNATLDEHGNHIDPSFVAADLLNDSSRNEGLAGDKRKRHPGDNHFRKKFYIPIDWNNTKMPIPTHTFVVLSGFPVERVRTTGKTKAGKPRYRTLPFAGQSEHYHLWADPNIESVDQCAMRRVACDCLPCHMTLKLPWDPKIAPDNWITQPRFRDVPDCMFITLVGNLNSWKCITVGMKPGASKIEKEEMAEETEEVYNDILEDYETRALMEVQEGGFGAMETDPTFEKDGYYMIKWTGEPYALEEASEDVQGCPEIMPRGTMVCQGQYMTRLNRAPHWFYHDDRVDRCIFRLQYIVAPAIVLEPYHKQNNSPNAAAWNGLDKRAKAKATTSVLKVPTFYQNYIKAEIKLRAKLDVEDIHYKMEAEEQTIAQEPNTDGEEEEEDSEQDEEEEAAEDDEEDGEMDEQSGRFVRWAD